MFFRQTCGLLAFSLTLACSTRHGAPAGTASVAILPLENDSSNIPGDGFGQAAPWLLQWQLDGNRDVYVFAAADENAAAARHASRIMYAWYTRSNAGIEAHFTLQDARARTIAIDTVRGDAAAVLNGMARTIHSGARMFRAEDDASIRQFGEVLHGDVTLVVQAAVTQPNPFLPEALAVSRILIESAHPQQAAQLLSQEAPAFARASPLDRARRDYVFAAAAGDRAAERHALGEVVGLAPVDPVSRRELADLQFEARDFRGAEVSFSELGRMEPWDGLIFNQLGYVRMYLHDAAGARDAIADYARVAPEQAANAADSLGEIEWEFHDFAAAEKNFLEASRGDIILLRGNDMLKAALARFLRGDRSGADALFQRYASWRASGGDALVPVRGAEWLYLTGRTREAELALIAAAAKLEGDAQAVAVEQLSFWALLEGRREDALEYARRAVAAARAPGVRDTAVRCAFYAAPSADPAEWQSRAAQAFSLPGPLRDEILGTALELDGNHQEAVAPLLKALAATSPTDDGSVRGMLIRAYRALGQTSEAGKLLWPMPLPFYVGNPVFDAAWFGEWHHDNSHRPGAGDHFLAKSESALTACHGSLGALSSRSSTRS